MQSQMVSSPDFQLGSLLVSPSRRQLIGTAGKAASLEPKVMQVFLLLAENLGQLVPRNTILDEIWGVPVGEDSLNRAIAGVRKALEISPGEFDLETVPRAGYRLSLLSDAQPEEAAGVSRRWALGSALGIGALAAAGGAWFTFDAYRDRTRAAELLTRGKALLKEGDPAHEGESVRLFEEASRLDPGNAKAWGLLALSHRNLVENGDAEIVSKALVSTEYAAKKALAIDPDEGFALTALATLQPEFGDWAATEKSLRDVLSRAPGTIPAMHSLVLLLQSVGRCAESNRLNDAILEIDPVDPIAMFRGAFKHWILGDTPGAIQAIERAVALWPLHPAVWNARMVINAFSGRAGFARQLLHSQPKPPIRMVPFWDTVLGAYTDRSKLAAAREVMLAEVPRNPHYAYGSVMALSGLGLIDDALAVARGYYLKEGPLAGRSALPPGQLKINDMQWRRTMILFLPVTAPLRAHPDFAKLCEDIGLGEYWRETGTKRDILPSDRDLAGPRKSALDQNRIV